MERLRSAAVTSDFVTGISSHAKNGEDASEHVTSSKFYMKKQCLRIAISIKLSYIIIFGTKREQKNQFQVFLISRIRKSFLIIFASFKTHDNFDE